MLFSIELERPQKTLELAGGIVALDTAGADKIDTMAIHEH
jgi:hypothetical protein